MPIDIESLSDEEVLALLRLERKRARARRYHQRHKDKINRKRREKYAREAAITSRLSGGNDADEER